MEVTFETKIWENDWKYILSGNYLKTIIDRCNLNFTSKTLIINNVKNKALVKEYVLKKQEEGVIDKFYFAEDYAEEVLAFFNISRSSFKGGYYYSIAELVGIYLCQSEYLVHFSSDSFMAKNMYNWIAEAINIMKNNKDIIVANPTWNYKYSQAQEESFDILKNFYVGYGFSDQCYLISTSVFKKGVYNELHTKSERYPQYGGELFEKRVDGFMRNHNLKRITHKHCSYLSENFSKNSLLKNNALIRRIYLLHRLYLHRFYRNIHVFI